MKAAAQAEEDNDIISNYYTEDPHHHFEDDDDDDEDYGDDDDYYHDADGSNVVIPHDAIHDESDDEEESTERDHSGGSYNEGDKRNYSGASPKSPSSNKSNSYSSNSNSNNSHSKSDRFQSPVQERARLYREEMLAAMDRAPQIRPASGGRGGGGGDDDKGDNTTATRLNRAAKTVQSDLLFQQEDPKELDREVREILQAAQKRTTGSTAPSSSSSSKTTMRSTPKTAVVTTEEVDEITEPQLQDIQAESTSLEGTSYHFSQSTHSAIPHGSLKKASTVASTTTTVPQSPTRSGGGAGRGRGGDRSAVSPMRQVGRKPSAGLSTSANVGTGRGGQDRTDNKDGLPRGSRSSHNQGGRDGKRSGNGGGGGGGIRISWKSDPDASFCDWTIKVYHDEGGGGMDLYRIHRNICGFGNRKSEYLLRAFRGEAKTTTTPGLKSDVTNNTTLLDLPASRARVFPMVLDFMYYTKESKSTLTAARACEVFRLAELLELPALQKAISDFYMKNLNLKNMGEFLTAATKCKTEPLLVVCKSKIGKMITEKPQLAGLVPPKYLTDILLISRRQLDDARAQNPERYSSQLVVSQSRYWSKAACICAAHNESILTKNLFEQLTGEDALPFIDASVAPKLLSLDAKFNKVGSEEYTSLQRRCIASISEDFGSFQRGFSSQESASDSLKELPSHVLADILVKSMNQGKEV